MPSVPGADNLLIGETVQRPNGLRESIMIDNKVKTRLLGLLIMEEMRGVGYSEFINRAIDVALLEMGYSEDDI